MRKSVSAALIALVLILSMMFSTAVAFADANPNVTVVNPVSSNTVYSSNLLISVKVTAPTTIKVTVYQKQKNVTTNGVTTSVTLTPDEYDKYKKDRAAGKETGLTLTRKEILADEAFKTDNNLTFYTKKLESVTPGVYDVKVSTLDGEGKVSHDNTVTAIVKEKPEETATTDSSGASQFLQNLLKNVFGS